MCLNKLWPWACSNRFDTALDSETEVDTSETPRAELERRHGNQLVSDLFLAWEITTEAIETEGKILDMVIDVRHLSEVWRSLTQMAAQMQDTGYDRAKNELELLQIRVSETVAECVARVYVVLRKLTRQKGKTLARQIKRRVRHGLTLRFPNEARLCTMKGYFEFRDLKAGLARVKSFQSYQERRKALVHVLAVAHRGGGKGQARGAASCRSCDGKRFGRRRDGGRGHDHEQQQHHPREINPGQQQCPQHRHQQTPLW